MTEILDKLKNNKIIGQNVTVKSALNSDSYAQLARLADEIAQDEEIAPYCRLRRQILYENA